MLTHLRPALVLLALLTLLTGIAYPLALTGLAQVALPNSANGSLETKDGKVVGSRLVGQRFSGDSYFHGRPSAAGADGYDASASSGSNLGPTSKKLMDRVAADVGKLRGEDTSSVPADSVTASASGLDPHISPAFAELQVARVAKARNLSVAAVRTLVTETIEQPFLGLIGEPLVNVLKLNIALDTKAASPAR